MSSETTPERSPTRGQCEIRVRYAETDRMGHPAESREPAFELRERLAEREVAGLDEFPQVAEVGIDIGELPLESRV